VKNIYQKSRQSADMDTGRALERREYCIRVCDKATNPSGNSVA
jgi:hypothetical protein